MYQREERPVRVPVTPSHREHKKQHPFQMGKAGRNGRGTCETPWRDSHKTESQEAGDLGSNVTSSGEMSAKILFLTDLFE